MSECLCERERQPDGFASELTNRFSVNNPRENMNSSVRRQPPTWVGDRQTNPLECVQRICLSSNEFTGTLEIRLSVLPVRIAICLTSPNPAAIGRRAHPKVVMCLVDCVLVPRRMEIFRILLVGK